MTFEHCNFLGDLELEKKETNGIRLYNLPNGDWVPSITSVTSFYNRQIFVEVLKSITTNSPSYSAIQSTLPARP